MKSTPRRPALSLLAPLTVILLLSTAGCQMWVKRGAGQADLQTDQAACKAETGSSDNAAFSDCMTGKGWYNNAPGSTANSSATIGSNASGTTTAATATATAAAGSMADKQPQTMTSSADGSAPAAIASTPASPETPAAPTVVNSWWKLGGGPGELFSTRKQCEANTGDTPSGNRYSQAFITCMKDHKWFAMQ